MLPFQNIVKLKKAVVFTLKSIGYVLLALLAYVIIGLGLSKITIDEEIDNQDDVAIYILTNGVHTDIVVPSKTTQKDWTTLVKPSHTIEATTEYPYLALGWGDKGFYLNTPTWADLKFSTALNAATGLSTSAMHTTYYKSLEESEDCIKIDISAAQYDRLTDYILNSFEVNEDDTLQLIATDSNYGNTDAFYEAKGSYSLFKTCNSWANTGLKEAGQKAALWTGTDTGIFEKYRPD